MNTQAITTHAIAAIACTLALAAAQPAAAAGKVVYVRSGTLTVADEESGKETTLATGLRAQTRPRWSPDGNAVLYWSPRGGGGGIQDVEISIYAAAGGKAPATWRVDYAGTPAMRLAGVREIKEVGWAGPGIIYVLGNISPSTDELRLFDAVKHDELPGYVGYGFSVCRTAPVVHFMQPKEKGPGSELVRNGIPLRAQPAAPVRLIAPDHGCNAWYAVETTGEHASLRRIGNERLDTVAALPFADYLRMEEWEGHMILFRPEGDVDDIDLKADRAAKDKQAATATIARRLQRSRAIGPNADWLP